PMPARHRALPHRDAAARAHRGRPSGRLLVPAAQQGEGAGRAARGGRGMNGGLSVRGLAVRYRGPGGWRTVVDGVDLDVPEGRVLGLVGESGSGKSTVARAILGLAPMLRGSAHVGSD